MIILSVFARVVYLALRVIMIAMFLRVILQFFPDAEDSALERFVCFLTEPVILPVRFILYLFGIGQDSPIDWSFSLTYLILVLIEAFLPRL